MTPMFPWFQNFASKYVCVGLGLRAFLQSGQSSRLQGQYVSTSLQVFLVFSFLPRSKGFLGSRDLRTSEEDSFGGTNSEKKEVNKR